MRCESVQDLLIDGRGAGDAAARRAALEHLSDCRSCRDAQYAVVVMHSERLETIPDPEPGALARAVAAAASAHAETSAEARLARREADAAAVSGPGQRRPLGFWSGMASGGSLAAAVAAAWIGFRAPQAPAVPSAAVTPEVTLALNETRDVSIAVDAPAALADAEIRVVLTGAIGLAGFTGQRELRWRTDLEAGNNQLTLPVTALGAAGGQLLVEVLHGERRKTFVVDVRST